jgi:hypothetical protein
VIVKFFTRFSSRERRVAAHWGSRDTLPRIAEIFLALPLSLTDPTAHRSIFFGRECRDRLPSCLRRWALAAGLFVLLSTPALALMIGAPQTRAELGRPLRMQIPVRLDTGETLPLSCVQAQASDDSGNAGGLDVSASPAADGLTLQLRSQQALREPILTVRLHLGCRFQRTQVYTLLVDPPGPEQPMIAGSASRAQAASAPAQPATPARAATTPPAALIPQHAPRLQRPVATRAAESRPAHAAAQRRRAPRQPLQQNRLELDALDVSTAVVQPRLRLALTLPPAQPHVSAEQRAELVQLRQLLFDAAAPAGRGQPTLQRIAALEARAGVLQRQFALASQQARQAEAELAQVRAQSVPATVAYALVAALGALALLSFWLWRRGADPGASASPFAVDAAASPAQRASAQPRVGAAPAPAAASVSTQLSTIQPPVMPFGLPPTIDGRPLQPEVDSPAQQRWSDSGFDWDSRFMTSSTPSKQVQVDELMDVGNLAEYFIETGDDERAIDLLEKSLDDGADNHFALPYLLLFELYRKHGRRQEYDALYRRFARRFNVAVPAWDDVAAARRPGRDLLDYDRAIARIVQDWGKPQIVSVLEHMLLDDPVQHRVGFDLPAYRDLLMLYAVARDLFPDAKPHSASPAAQAAAQPTPTAVTIDFELPLEPQATAVPAVQRSDEPRAAPRDRAEPGKG